MNVIGILNSFLLYGDSNCVLLLLLKRDILYLVNGAYRFLVSLCRHIRFAFWVVKWCERK